MSENSKTSAFILGVCLFSGLVVLGYLLSNAAITFKAFERTVTAKGLSEREFQADVVVWPIQFNVASNDLADMYHSIESNSSEIKAFLTKNDILADGITFSSPAITDKSAQNFNGMSKAEFRYSALQTVTVYSKKVEKVRHLMSALSELGKRGIVFTGEHYQTEYFFIRLNEVKPKMIEEATKKAREVAQKFAADSASKLGKIKRASQGQFSITPRDQYNPHIKKVRVVSTVVYYLSD